MKEAFLLDGFQLLVKKSQLKPTIILLGSALIVTCHRYIGSIAFGTSFLPGFDPVLYMFLSAFVLLGLIPALIIKLVFKEPLARYGWQVGDWRLGFRSVLVFSPLILGLLLFPAAHTEEMRLFYPLDRSVQTLSSHFFLLQLWRGVLFYIAWEFFFRGFLLFGLRPFVGDWLAICIQTIPQCLWHIGMPSGEIFFSIAGGILFGMLALRTRSILWPLLLHFFIGVATDGLIILT